MQYIPILVILIVGVGIYFLSKRGRNFKHSPLQTGQPNPVDPNAPPSRLSLLAWNSMTPEAQSRVPVDQRPLGI